MPTIFANTANPVFIPVSIFQQTMVKELRGAGGQVWKGMILSLARTHTDIALPKRYTFWPITLLQKIHSRCWRSSSAKKKYTAAPYKLNIFRPSWMFFKLQGELKALQTVKIFYFLIFHLVSFVLLVSDHDLK